MQVSSVNNVGEQLRGIDVVDDLLDFEELVLREAVHMPSLRYVQGACLGLFGHERHGASQAERRRRREAQMQLIGSNLAVDRIKVSFG